MTDLQGGASSSALRTAAPGSSTSAYDHVNDTVEASVSYRIINKAGYAFPSTGGSRIRVSSVIGYMFLLSGAVWRLCDSERKRALSITSCDKTQQQ